MAGATEIRGVGPLPVVGFLFLSVNHDKPADLGCKSKRLPKSRPFCTKVSDTNPEVSPLAPDRLATVMQNEFRNIYERCGYDAACT